ncbi:hypothetical protein ANCDUO_02573 [Ancylostoma duodenale]|uniref:Uncharacterized protein n=1 Tax=Ancylostoma duodenale TaxID=51022 RepID=A0A0C2DBD2_9BILA|nr:hypothetical protein ANCDUO_02573 [Ancylostoma duodenale]
MRALYNRSNGARHSNFEVDDAICAKDYCRQKTNWTSGFVVRRIGNVKHTVCCGHQLWNCHINQLRGSKPHLILNQLLDVFDLPLFDSTADTDDSMPEHTKDLPTPSLRRS